MSTAILQRILYSIVLIIAVVVLDFLLIQAAPGDVVDTILTEAGGGDPALAASIRASYGLDKPIPVQLITYLGKMLTDHTRLARRPRSTARADRHAKPVKEALVGDNEGTGAECGGRHRKAIAVIETVDDLARERREEKEAVLGGRHHQHARDRYGARHATLGEFLVPHHLAALFGVEGPEA